MLLSALFLVALAGIAQGEQEASCKTVKSAFKDAGCCESDPSAGPVVLPPCTRECLPSSNFIEVAYVSSGATLKVNLGAEPFIVKNLVVIAGPDEIRELPDRVSGPAKDDVLATIRKFPQNYDNCACEGEAPGYTLLDTIRLEPGSHTNITTNVTAQYIGTLVLEPGAIYETEKLPTRWDGKASLEPSYVNVLASGTYGQIRVLSVAIFNDDACTDVAVADFGASVTPKPVGGRCSTNLIGDADATFTCVAPGTVQVQEYEYGSGCAADKATAGVGFTNGACGPLGELFVKVVFSGSC